MSMNDDPRGFRRGQPANREYSQQQRGPAQQQPRDRFDQYAPRPDARPARPHPQSQQQGQPAPSQGQAEQDKPAAAFSAYKPEAYAKSEPPEADPDWGPQPQQRPSRAPMHADLPPPPRQDMSPPARPESSTNDPFEIPSDMSSDPFYQPASSDPYASRSDRDFGGDWQQGNFDDTGGNAFQNFYAQDEEPGFDQFDNNAQSTHDEFFAQADHGREDVPPPPPLMPSRDGHDFDDRGFDDRAFGAAAPPAFDDHFGDQQNGRHGRGGPAPFQEEQVQYHKGYHDQSSGFDNENGFEWDEFEQAPPPPAAVRQFHPPAVRDEDLDADFFADEDDYDIDEYESGGGGKKKLLAAVLAGAIVVGGGGAYIYTNGEGGFGDVPSIITADSSPIKEQPEEPGGRDFPNGNKLIYDRLGGEEESGAQLASAGSSSETADEALPGIVTTGGTLEERIENALRAQGQGGGNGASEKSADSPRTVQTLTFSPDGSQQPVQPSTRSVSVDDSNPLGSGIVVSGQPASSVVVSNQPSSAPTGRVEPPVAGGAPATNSVNAVPAGQPDQTQVAAIAPQQTQSQGITASAGGTGNYFVQIGARNDPQAATEAFKTLQQRYASVIGNYGPSLRKADLGSKGVWYRLWVGPVDDKVEAEALCEQLKLAGMKACLVRKDQ